ncbi:MAG: hypothetical protein N2572_08025 [Syntrophales bacterium]|nr:hypothetical protein [Syntrophales bacterium]
MKINTVTGPIAPEDLGVTLIHEHFFFGYPGWYGDISVVSQTRHELLEKGLVMARILLSHGVKTVVDATTNETGRDVTLLKEISEQTGLQIVCSTGYYYERGSAPAYFKARSGLGRVEDEIYEMFLTEATMGIGKTGIRAGVIKVASSRDEITRYEKWFFRAAARASGQLGIPIITHTQEGKLGPEQASFLIAEGAQPHKIMIGHMCGNTNLSYHVETLSFGVYIGFDRFGVEGIVGMPTDRSRINCLVDLLSRGYERKIMLSQDYVHHWLGRPGMEKLASNANPAHLFCHVIPALKEAGISKIQIKTMLEDNPRRFLGGNEDGNTIK